MLTFGLKKATPSTTTTRRKTTKHNQTQQQTNNQQQQSTATINNTDNNNEQQSTITTVVAINSNNSGNQQSQQQSTTIDDNQPRHHLRHDRQGSEESEPRVLPNARALVVPAISEVDGSVRRAGQEAEGVGHPYRKRVVDQTRVQNPDPARRVSHEGGGGWR